jgi:hypothetical protein
MLNPNQFFSSSVLSFTAAEDWKKAIRIQRDGPTRVPLPMEEWQWRPSVHDVKSYFWRMTAFLDNTINGFGDPGPWSIDFEATLKREIVCLGIWSCHEPTKHRGIVIPFLSQGGVPYWSPEDELVVLDLVRAFFTDARRHKIGQNTVGYDTGYPPFNQRSLIKQAWGIDVAGILGDTMVAHHVCFPELRHGLAFLSSISTDLGPYKEELWDAEQGQEDDAEKDWTRILERSDMKVRVYCGKDCYAQAEVWNALALEMAP